MRRVFMMGAVGLLLLLGDAQRQAPRTAPVALTFEDRVAAQAVIERVYHRHRTGFSQPFELAVPTAVLERKVHTSLRQSVALQDYWKTPITAQMLRRELDRIEASSRFPERLEEIRAALGHDDSLLMETLVRAGLADRLSRRFQTFDRRVQGQVRSRARQSNPDGLIVEQPDAFEMRSADDVQLFPKVDWETWWAGASAAFDETKLIVPSPDAGHEDVREPAPPALVGVDDLWGNGLDELIPEERSRHTAVWTGSEMIIWGSPASGALTGLGASYDPLVDQWKPISEAGAASREDHLAVWTGSVMVVWGGKLLGSVSNTGGRYDPASDTWTPTSTVGAPSPRFETTAVWTGTEMIVWGGYVSGGTALNTGARYDPINDTWQPTTLAGAPETRHNHTAVWTGSRMIVWGGVGPGGHRNTGGQYDPVNDVWTPTSTVDAATGRTNHSAVWTGTEMIIWGATTSGFTPGGARYNPATDKWEPTNPVGDPGTRENHSAVWTGQEMVVWGGWNSVLFNNGGRYNPQTDSWTPTTLVNAPEARQNHSTIWTGQLMVIWSGSGFNPGSTGGRYDPATDSWTPTKSVRESPEPLYDHTVVWTGSEMIIWGGQSSTGVVGTGRRYDAVRDIWAPTSTTGAPAPRTRHTAVWTGSRMVVWGGEIAVQTSARTGGRYDPVSDTWAATTLSAAPGPREEHTAVWTGTEMIVWGGYNLVSGSIVRLDDGGRYNPVTNVWTPMSVDQAPTARHGQSMVWTGSEVIVWGGNSLGNVVESTGGRYIPAIDHWTPTLLLDAPQAREGHTAVWTGSEMIVWGGFGSDKGALQIGGRLNPNGNQWTATTVIGAPSVRGYHSAIWTGEEMIVFGGIWAPTPFTAADLDTGGRYDPDTDAWTSTTVTNAPTPRFDHTALWTGRAMVVWGGSHVSGDIISRVDDRAVRWYGVQVLLPPDTDGDGTFDETDCDAANAGAWGPPGEVVDLDLTDAGMIWSPPVEPGGDPIAYDTLRSGVSFNFVGGTTCIESGDGSDTLASDPGVPPVGAVFFYLVRALNGCPGLDGHGPLGAGTDGTPRVGRSCP